MVLNKNGNRSAASILKNCIMAFVSLFINGLGVFLTIHASIGAGPWDVLHLGFSKTLGISYGTASISASLAILLIDILLKQPIGLAMIIDALTVGKAVDFFDHLGIIPVPSNLFTAILMIFIGLAIIGITQYSYMAAALGCGPRDTLLVGLKKLFHKIPIGVVSIGMLSAATLVGFLMGGQVGIGTLIIAFCAGPVMQFEFDLVGFDAAGIRHQNIKESLKVISQKRG